MIGVVFPLLLLLFITTACQLHVANRVRAFLLVPNCNCVTSSALAEVSVFVYLRDDLVQRETKDQKDQQVIQ